jgi:putative transposase
VVTGDQQRAAAAWLAKTHKVSERRVARALHRSRSTVRYRRRVRPGEAPLVKALRRLASRHRRYGYRRLHALLVRDGWPTNVKRVRRLCRSLGLQTPKRRKTKGKSRHPGTAANSCQARPATQPNEVWTCDFIHDRTVSGGSLKWLSVVDEYTRELLLLQPAAAMAAAEVRRLFGRLVGWRGPPARLRCDNGGEFVGAALATWLPGQGVELTPVAAASPWQNGFVESFHSRLRDEFLDGAGIENVADAKARAASFKREYNEVRPHSGLNYETPKAFATRCGEKAGRRKRVGAGGNPPDSVRA